MRHGDNNWHCGGIATICDQKTEISLGNAGFA
jgi:hypothetical protein